MSYSVHTDLKTIFADIESPDVLGPGGESEPYRNFAFDWLNDMLRGNRSVPISSPSETVVLTEANYAVYLILRAYRHVDYYKYLSDAKSLLDSLLKEQLNGSIKGGAYINSADVQRKFTSGKTSVSGVYLGDEMGKTNKLKGTLDDW